MIPTLRFARGMEPESAIAPNGHARPINCVLSINGLLGLLCWMISGYDSAMGDYEIASVVPDANALSELDFQTRTLSAAP